MVNTFFRTLVLFSTGHLSSFYSFLFLSDAGYCVIQTGYDQLIEEAKPDVADMPKEAIHPATYRRRGLLASRC